MATGPATTERKPNPNAPKPKQNLLLIGGILLALGALWFGYEAVRPLTPDELKDKKEEEEREAENKRDAEREAKRHQH